MENIQRFNSDSTKFRAFGGGKLIAECGFTAEIKVERTGITTQATFYAFRDVSKNLICLETGRKLNIIKAGAEIDKEEILHHLIQFNPLKEFPKVPGFQVRFAIDLSVPPKKNPHRKIPIAYQDEVKKKLNELIETGIIERVHHPVNWISPMVIARKKRRKYSHMH